MKITNTYKILFSFALLLVISLNSHAQFNNPIIQVGLGIAEPMGDMKGTYYNYFSGAHGLQFIGPNTDLFTINYGAKTGLNFFGNGKINFDKYGITRGVVGISFSTFNTFEPTKSGNVGVQYQPVGGGIDTTGVPATFNYTFNTFGFNLGVEIAPTSFTNKLSPYFGARISLNTFNAKMSWTTTRLDTTTFSANDFRIGVMFDAGIEFKFNKMFGMVLGANYNLGNLLLKNTNNSLADWQKWGSSNSSINDAEGQFWSSLYNGIITDGTIRPYNAKQKNINWGSVYLGLNIYLGGLKNKQQPPKK